MPIVFLPKAVPIPGALHICSNLTKDIAAKFKQWDWFHRQLKNIESLLSVRDRRERFAATCMPDVEASSRFKYFSASLYDKRWGEVVNFCRKLQDLIEPLREHWDHQKFMRGYNAEKSKDDAGGFSFDARALTATLGDPSFHVYMHVIFGILEVLDNTSTWLEGCSCHEHLLTNRSGAMQKSSLAKEFGLSGVAAKYTACPMKGKRSAEMAAGRLTELCDGWWHTLRDSTVERIAQAAAAPQNRNKFDDAAQVSIWEDFEAGHAYLELGLQVKFDFWNRTPWLLAGIAHHDTDTARRVASKACEAFDELHFDDPAFVHHPLTLCFLQRDSLVRAEVNTFIASGVMGDRLKLEAAKLRLTPVVERSIEAKHALVTRRAGRHFRTGRVVSLTLRMPDLLQCMHRDHTYFDQVVSSFARSRTPYAAAAALGIASHPLIVEAAEK